MVHLFSGCDHLQTAFGRGDVDTALAARWVVRDARLFRVGVVDDVLLLSQTVNSDNRRLISAARVAKHTQSLSSRLLYATPTAV